jgi:hypothetical protein
MVVHGDKCQGSQWVIQYACSPLDNEATKNGLASAVAYDMQQNM